MKDLFDARVHLGHKLATDQMRPFIYGNRFGVNIIDLDETALLLRQALNFLAHIAYRNGIILFVARQVHSIYFSKMCNTTLLYCDALLALCDVPLAYFVCASALSTNCTFRVRIVCCAVSASDLAHGRANGPGVRRVRPLSQVEPSHLYSPRARIRWRNQFTRCPRHPTHKRGITIRGA